MQEPTTSLEHPESTDLIRKRENLVRVLVRETRNLLEQGDIDSALAFFR